MSHYNLCEQVDDCWVYSESNYFNSRSMTPEQSKRATGDDKPVSGTKWAPIEIPDSPSREKSPHQQDESQRIKNAKRAREEKLEVEICSDPFIKMKKTKPMHQCQNQIIEKQQIKSELPSLQIDSDNTNHIAVCNDIQFEKKDLVLEGLPAKTMLQESLDDFSFYYEGESVDDFIGMEDFRLQENVDGCCYLKESIDDFSDLEDFRELQESVDDLF